MHIGHILFSINGRISRKIWWLSQILVWVFAIGTTAIYHKFGFHDAIFGMVLTILLFAMRLAINIKRLHDQGLSGWWLLAFEIPVIGWIAGFIVLGCRKGHEGENDYGMPTNAVELKKAGVLLLLLCVFIGGCAGAIAIEEFATSEAGLTAIELGTLTIKKIIELHEAGVDEKILDEVRDAINQAHAIIDRHHKEAVGQ